MSKAKRETRRYDHKRDRQAARAAIRGDHVKQPLTSSWGHRPDLAPITDESQQISPRGNTRGRGRRCKRAKDGKHSIIINPNPRSVSYGGIRRWTITPPFICEHCNKHFWSRPRSSTPVVTHLPDHYSLQNIQLRLAGHKCCCPECIDNRTEN